tara:strand:+ start:8263 stop:9699 length:1437 start_codon:yes stop_codon:yes gene_type:complete
MPTEIRGGQIKDDSITGDDVDESTLIVNTLKDADGDTKIQVEESADEDKIRFDIAGSEKVVLDATGLGVGTASPATTFHAYANVSNTYVATIDNDQASAGHVLKLSTDGNGSGSRLLEMEDGDGDILFRARADGRFGFGPDGVDSMGAGTFVVGIDNSSHTADIAISQRLQHLGDSNTYLDFPSADTFNLVAGGGSFLKYDNSSSKILINNANENRDTQIMADNGSVVLHVDAGTNKVGIGATAPAELLTINAAADGDECFIQFQEGDADRAKVGINTSNNLLIHNQFINKHIVFKVNDQGNTREALRIDGAVSEVVVNQSSDSLVDFRVESDNNTHMLFVDGSVNKVGINDSTPTSTLSIMGSLALSVLNINAANDPGTTYAIADTDCVIIINTRPQAQGGIDSAITLTLPSAASNPGMVITVKDAAGYSDVNAITIQRDPSGSDTIDGVDTSISISTPAAWRRLISDGSSAWYRLD